jgi:Dolichyl-phosphate-mannose-protein mannosyltransferase
MAPPDRRALGLVLAALPLRLLLALATDLSPDEAYYVAASRLRLTIADHPPLTPWLAGITEWTSIPLELRVRWPALVVGTLFGLLCVELVRRRGGDASSQRWCAVFTAWLALPLAGGFLLTPDVVSLTFALALALVLEVDHERRVLQVIGIALLCFGGMVTKVSMLIPATAVILSSKRWSERLSAFGGVLAALPLAAPSIAFQWNHAFVDRSAAVGAPAAVAAAVGAQLMLWGPAVFWFGWRRAMDHRFDRIIVGLMTVSVIASAALRGVPPEPNWFALGAVMLAVGASHAMHPAPTWLRITTVILGPVLALLFASHVIHPWLPLPANVDPSARLHGWSTGQGPEQAPGIGPYGPSAEACIYQGKCEQITLKSNR